MAEYIEREALVNNLELLARHEDKFRQNVILGIVKTICNTKAADVVPVVRGSCPICSGQEVLVQDCDNGYSVEIDAEQGEMTIWQGDTCLVAISIDYCPVCGARCNL